jgi:hypothetical protein
VRDGKQELASLFLLSCPLLCCWLPEDCNEVEEPAVLEAWVVGGGGDGGGGGGGAEYVANCLSIRSMDGITVAS